MDHHIPDKANKVLNVIILGFLLILIRVWILSVVQHEDHLEKARRPKRRTVIDKVERATIRDRFNIPLALNKIQYNAAVCYADIRQIPSSKWVTAEDGKRRRVQVRLNYIKELSDLLSKELLIDAQLIEDTIHGKASLFPHTPFVIKEDLSEKQYYRLKALEKDWAGIRTEKGSQRYYPLGKVGCDIIGYMGAISSKYYRELALELSSLQEYLTLRESGESPILPKGFSNPLEVRERVKTLQEKSYTIHDLVGKSGVENTFDTDLRGFTGRAVQEVDTKGNILRELPGGRKSLCGRRLLLSISSELQKFAEELLIANETERELRHSNGDPDLSAPWIKGGAIVALDPTSGEVLALASYPRIDPNDFIPCGSTDVKARKLCMINKWLENETYIGEIWDGKRPLERERWNQTVYTEALFLSLDKYWEAILSQPGQTWNAIQQISSAKEALLLQSRVSEQGDVAGLIETLYPEGAAHLSERLYLLKQQIDPILGGIKNNVDKLLVIDLCRLLVSKERTPDALLPYLSGVSLAHYRALNQAASIVKHYLKAQNKAAFHAHEFQEYRNTYFKEFLKEKRKEEKKKKQFAKPYTDYLEHLEKEQFNAFWNEKGEALVHAFLCTNESPLEIAPYLSILRRELQKLGEKEQRQLLHSFRSFEELNSPLYGKYRALRHTKGVQLERHLAAAFYPISGYGYGRSQAYRQSTPQGSVFKLVVAYQALLERMHSLKEAQNLNPLTLVDNLQWHSKPNSPEQIVGFSIEGKPIKRLYKGGFLPRSHGGIGSIDLIGALEQSSNIYFALLASDHIKDPSHLIQTTENFGFGEKTGIELPGEIAGGLPKDLSHNRTGLYTFAIGQHSLVVTPLQTAVMLSSIANKGEILKPKILQAIAGQEPLREYQDPFSSSSYPFKECLASIGIHFPLFTSTVKLPEDPHVWINSVETKRHIPMPTKIRSPLLEGMCRVITGVKGTARPGIIRALRDNPTWAKNFNLLKQQLIGKTGTAEILYKHTIDSESKAHVQNHIWFGGIAFTEEDHQTWENPELTIVVYLRSCQAGGKEAAPLAAEMVKKWREIRKQHGKSAHMQ